jgi:hypothetical protein
MIHAQDPSVHTFGPGTRYRPDLAFPIYETGSRVLFVRPAFPETKAPWNNWPWHPEADALVASEAFAPEFARLVDAGYSWMTLVRLGALGDALVVGIELPPQPVRVGPNATPVAISGPARRPTTGGSDYVDWHFGAASSK